MYHPFSGVGDETYGIGRVSIGFLNGDATVVVSGGKSANVLSPDTTTITNLAKAVADRV